MCQKVEFLASMGVPISKISSQCNVSVKTFNSWLHGAKLQQERGETLSPKLQKLIDSFESGRKEFKKKKDEEMVKIINSYAKF